MQKIKFFLLKLFIPLKHFFKMLDQTAKNAIKEAVAIVEIIKKWDGEHQELVNFITAAIPGQIDNIIVDKIRMILNRLGDWKVLEGNERKLFLHNLSLQFSLVLSDGKLTFNDVVYLVQWYYDNHKTVTPPAALLDDNNELLKKIEATQAKAAAVEIEPVKSNEELHTEGLKRIADAHKEN